MTTATAPATREDSSFSPIEDAGARELPRVILRPRKALPFFSGHPWVFAGAVDRVLGKALPGEEVLLCSHEQEPIARGLYNPHSNIRVRLFGAEADRPLDRAFWSLRLDEALNMRRRLLGPLPKDGAWRLVFSEADTLSGLIVDWYAGVLVVQFKCLAFALRARELCELLIEKLSPSGVCLRLDKELHSAEGFDAVAGDFEALASDLPKPPEAGLVFVEEGGVRYGVDVLRGHKTGLYLDQSENRLAAARYMAGRSVLDCFCYTGGFGLAAVVAGKAREVLGIDSSSPALAAAKANAELNGVGERLRYEKTAAFPALERLKSEGARFGAVVLDPPKLAKSRSGLANAMRAYHSLNRLAVELLEEDGLLTTCSCSGHVTRDMFEEMLSTVAAATGRRIQILEARTQAPDHPVSVQCQESLYLKCYLCRVA